MNAALIVLLSAGGCLAASAGPKVTGAVILTSEAGRPMDKTLDEARAELAARFSVETALSADQGSIQAAVERLERRRVKKIVAVPLLLSSHSAEMDQNRYLFGIRQEPSRDFLASPHERRGFSDAGRVRGAIPLVLAPALDDHALVVEMLADRVSQASREPAKEALLAVAAASPADARNSQWLGTLTLAVDKARRKAGLPRAEVFVLRDGVPQAERDQDKASLRRLALAMSRKSRLIVAPLSLDDGGLEARLSKALDGVFMRKAKGLLPDARVARWALATAALAERLPDMRTFKQDNRPHFRRKSR